MRRITYMAVVLLAVMAQWSGEARAQEAAPPKTEPAAGLRMRVELKVSMAGRTAQAATNAAVREAKDQAINDYIESAVPAALRSERREEIKAVLADRDRYVISYETAGSRVEGEWLILEFWVMLDQARLDAALKRSNLTPARGLPRTLVVVTGAMAGSPVESGWDKAPGVEGRLNGCERLLAREFENYGFEVVRPAADAPTVNPTQVVSPEGPEEKAEVFRRTRETHRAGVLVIGLVSSKPAEGGEGAEVTVKVAALDTAAEEVAYSDQGSGRFVVTAATDRDQALEELCAPLVGKVVEAMFKRLTPEFEPGGRREISVVVSGVSSYFQMKEIERKLREESPGAETVMLSRMSPGEIEFKVATTADPATLANWLATNRFEGLTIAAEVKDDTHIAATAEETALPPPPPAPGGTVAPAPASTAEPAPKPAPKPAPAPRAGDTAQPKPNPSPE